MKNRTVAVAFAVVAMCASATEYVWQPTSNTSILTALDWNIADNWYPNTGTPTTSADIASFPSVGTSTTYYFVTSAVPVNVGRIESSASPARTVFVSDSAVSVNIANQNTKNVALYAPVIWSNSTYMATQLDFCDTLRVASGKRLVGNSATTYFRYDRFAKSADASRVDEFEWGDNGIGMYSGNYYIYGPGSLDSAATSSWIATAGSPYLIPVGGHQSGLNMVPGGPVRCDGVIPSGAFLKRIFPNGEIEISAPALADSASATVTFAAFTPSVRQKLKVYFHANGAPQFLLYKKTKTYDFDIVLEGIDWTSSAPADRRLILAGDYRLNWLPIIHVAGDCSPENWVPVVIVKYAKLSLEAKGTTAKNGFDHCNLMHYNASSLLSLYVPDGETQKIYSMTNLVGTVYKNDPGTVVVGMPDSTRNTGTLQIDAGTFAVTDDASAPIAEIGTLTVAANAALRLPVQGMRSNTAFTFNSGAILETPVRADGTTAALSVAGSATVSAGTVRLSGDTKNLKAGDHVVLSGAGLSSAAGWSVDASTIYEGCSASLKVVGGNLVMSYRKPGLVLFVR